MPGFNIGGGGDGFAAALDYDEAARIQKNLSLLQRYAPRMVGGNPTAAYTLAERSATSEEMLRSAFKTSNYVDVEETKRTLDESPSDYADAYFNSLPKTMQRQLRELDYSPPAERGGAGWFDLDIDNPLEAVGAVASTLKRAAGNALPDMVGEGLNTALGSLPRLITRVYRTVEYANDQGGAGGGFWDTGSFTDAWRAVEDGDEVFYGQFENRAKEMLDGDEEMMNVARKLAGGNTVTDIVKANGFVEDTPEYFQRVMDVYAMQSDPQLLAAVEELKRGKMSVGRSMANWLNQAPGLDDNYRGWYYDLISGTIDGAVQFIDPTLIAGWGLRAGKLMKYSTAIGRAGALSREAEVSIAALENFRNLDRAITAGEKISGNGMLGRFLAHEDRAAGAAIASARQTVNDVFANVAPGDRYKALRQAMPKMAPAWDEMKAWHQTNGPLGKGLDTFDGYWDFFTTKKGQMLLAGEVGGYGRTKHLVPHITRGDQLKASIKTWGESKIDDLAVRDSRAADILKMQDEGALFLEPDALKIVRDVDAKTTAKLAEMRKTHRVLRNVSRATASPFAQTAKSLLQHVNESQWLKFDDVESIDDFSRLAQSMGLMSQIPQPLIEHYIARYAGDVDQFGRTVVNQGVQRLAAQDMMRNVLRIAGAEDEVIARWAGELHGYSMDPTNGLIDMGGRKVPGALLPYEGTAGGIAVPRLKDLMPQFKNRALLQHTIGSSPLRWVDRQVGQIWTPAVLMRIAFIPRAFGEEALHLFLSESKQTWATERIAMAQAYSEHQLGGKIYSRRGQAEATARNFAMKDEEARAILSGLGMSTEDLRSPFAYWTDEQYRQINKLESHVTRPVTWGMHAGSRKLADWLSEAYPSASGRVTEFDNWAQFQAANSADVLKAGMLIPIRGAKKGLIAAARGTELYDPDRVEFHKTLMWGEYTSMGQEMLDAATHMLQDATQKELVDVLDDLMVSEFDSTGKVIQKAADLNKSDIIPYGRTNPHFFHFQHRKMRRMVQDPVAAPGIRELYHYVDPTTLGDTHRLLRNHGFALAGDDPVEALTNLKKWMSSTKKLSPNTLRDLRQALAGDEDLFESVIKKLRSSKQADVKRFANLVDELDTKPGLRALIRGDLPGEYWTGTLDDLKAKVAETLVRQGYKPEHIKKMRSLSSTSAGLGEGAAVNRVPKGFSPVHIPLVEEANWQTVLDTQLDQFEPILERHLALAGATEKQIDQVKDALLNRKDVLTPDELPNTVTQMREWRDTPYVPAFNWGSSDPEIARAVSRALGEVTGSTSKVPVIGQHFLPDDAVAQSAKHAFVDSEDGLRREAWRVSDGGGGVKSVGLSYKDGQYYLDSDTLGQLRLLDPSDNTKVYRATFRDGTEEIIDEPHVQRMRDEIEKRVADMPKRARAAKGEVRTAAAQARDDLTDYYDGMFSGEFVGRMAYPPPRAEAGGEWDWFFGMAPAERRYVQQHWMTKTGGILPEELTNFTNGMLDSNQAIEAWVNGRIKVAKLDAVANREEFKSLFSNVPVAEDMAPHLSDEFEGMGEIEALLLGDPDMYRSTLEDLIVPKLSDSFPANGPSLDALMKDWSERLSNDIIDTFVSPKGRVLDEIVERGVSDPNRLSFESLYETPILDFYPQVTGERVLLKQEPNRWQKVTNGWFNNVIGPAGAVIARNQRFHRVAWEAYQTVKPIVDDMILDQALVSKMDDIATKLGVSADEISMAWKNLGEEMRTKIDGMEADRVSDVLLRKVLGLEDPAMTEHFIDKTGRQWGPIYGADGAFDKDAYGVLMAARREGIAPTWELALSGDEIATLRKYVDMTEVHQRTLTEAIHTAAWNDVSKFVDDRRFRSLFQEVVGNLVPFQFAEEQFLKRWGRTFAQSPEAIFQAMLIMNGFRKVGWIKTDPNTGEDYYIYPGTGQMTMAIEKGINAVFGKEVVIPMETPLTGSVQYSMPGLDGSIPGAPNPGPVFGVTVQGLGSLFPELKPALGLVGGKQSEGRPWYSFFVPTSMQRAYEVAFASEEDLASATMEAMAYLEYSGHGLPDDASAVAVDIYQQKVKNHARVLLGMRAVVGFAGPSAASALAPGHEIAEDLRQLFKSGVPIDDAMGAFIKRWNDEDRDVTPFTVFGSESASGAYLPQTQEALDFMVSNRDYLRSFKNAGPWLLPQPGEHDDDEFIRDAYYEQLSNGMRTQLGIDEWYEKVRFKAGASTYFNSVQKKEIALLEAGDNTDLKREINDAFSNWQQAYFNQHPIFARDLQGGNSNQERQDTIDEMEILLSDPDMPVTQAAAPMRTLINSWRKFESAYAAYGSSRAGIIEDQKLNTKIAFANWAELFISRNPHVKDFYRSQIEPLMNMSYSQEQMVGA